MHAGFSVNGGGHCGERAGQAPRAQAVDHMKRNLGLVEHRAPSLVLHFALPGGWQIQAHEQYCVEPLAQKTVFGRHVTHDADICRTGPGT